MTTVWLLFLISNTMQNTDQMTELTRRDPYHHDNERKVAITIANTKRIAAHKQKQAQKQEQLAMRSMLSERDDVMNDIEAHLNRNKLLAALEREGICSIEKENI